MPGHRKTCRRYDNPGDAHFLTFSCFRRLPLLNYDRTRNWFLDALRLGQDRRQFDLWAYVVMPEHVHLIVLPLDGTRVSAILTTLKRSTSNRALHWLRRHAPEYLPNLLDQQPNGDQHYRFWQRGGGYDRNLRSVRDIHEKIVYVHENPVRRGLVEKNVDWRWSSAAAWVTGVNEPLPIDRSSVPPLTILDEQSHGPLMRRLD
ncbi:MAG: transposase [Bythopirellula sp.]|nr:transposase [Bythopirellula sp.]